MFQQHHIILEMQNRAESLSEKMKMNILLNIINYFKQELQWCDQILELY